MVFSSLSHAHRSSAGFALPVLWAPDRFFYLFLCVLASLREVLLRRLGVRSLFGAFTRDPFPRLGVRSFFAALRDPLLTSLRSRAIFSDPPLNLCVLAPLREILLRRLCVRS